MAGKGRWEGGEEREMSRGGEVRNGRRGGGKEKATQHCSERALITAGGAELPA